MEEKQRNRKEIKMFTCILENLSKDPSVKVRVAVATNILTPENILKRLAKDTSFNVRRVVQGSKHVSSELIELLNKRQALLDERDKASQFYTSLDSLEKLARDKDFAVRQGVASNPKTQKDILATPWRTRIFSS